MGFIGAGGAGVLLAILSGPFNLEIDTAIGTALAAMCVVTVFGAFSHYRERNVDVRSGLIVGLTGVGGAAIGATLSQGVPDSVLKIGAGLALWMLAALVWLRTRFVSQNAAAILNEPGPPSLRTAVGLVGLGATGGISAGFFGVGMAPYLQLGFLTIPRLNLRMTIGTTMWALVFIAASGATVLASHGDISLPHLVGALLGLSTGSFTGAKLTGRAPIGVLRRAVILVPVLAGAMVLFL